jgi:hypothetical protein
MENFSIYIQEINKKTGEFGLSFSYGGDSYTATSTQDNFAETLEMGKIAFFEATYGERLQDIIKARDKDAMGRYMEAKRDFDGRMGIVRGEKT